MNTKKEAVTKLSIKLAQLKQFIHTAEHTPELIAFTNGPEEYTPFRKGPLLNPEFVYFDWRSLEQAIPACALLIKEITQEE